MNEKLNGSVDRLADSLRNVFSEAVEGAVAPLTTEVNALRTDMKALRIDMKALRTDMKALRTDMNDQVKTTNENMQAQFAEQEKKIGKLIKGQVAS